MQNKSLLFVLFKLFVDLLGSRNCRENRFKTEKKTRKKKTKKLTKTKQNKTQTPARKINKTVKMLRAIGSY